jgi:8-oxo-dGTP pyrophosphatase MutT (NUDIX family)
MAWPDTTEDGQPIAKEKPFGACIVIYRESGGERQFLIMHRAHDGPDYDGDWAWTPPSGSRWPGEAIDDCARRELAEETGLDLPLIAAPYDDETFAVYVACVEADCVIAIDSEHDRFEWVSEAEAKRRCTPAVVAAEFDVAIAVLTARA